MSYKPISIDELDNFRDLKKLASIELGIPENQIIVKRETQNSLKGIEFLTLGEYILRERGENKDDSLIIGDLLDRGYRVEDILFSWLTVIQELNPDEPLDDLIEKIDFLETANTLLKARESKEFNDAEDVINNYERWNDENAKAVKWEEVEFAKTREINQGLRKVTDNFLLSPGFLVESIVTANPVLPANFNPLDATPIFNNMKASKAVPYIEYVKDDKTFYRIWSGDKTEEDEFNIKYLDNPTSLPNFIYMKVWTGPLTSPISKAPQTSFVWATYDIINNTLNLEAPGNVDKNELNRRIQEALALPFQIRGSSKIKVEYYFYDVPNLERSVFLDFVGRDDVGSDYMYFNEADKPWPLRTRFEIYFNKKHNSADKNFKNRFALNQGVMTPFLDPQIIDENGDIQKLKVVPKTSTKKKLSSNEIREGTYFYKITMVSSSISEADRYMTILNKLLKYYFTKQSAVSGYYLAILGKPPAVKTDQKKASANILKQRKRGVTRAGSKIAALQNLEPEMFKAPYSRSCQEDEKKGLHRQPAPVPIEEVNFTDPSNPTVGTWTKDSSVAVIGFPKDNPTIYLRCPDKRTSNPGVLVNKNVKNDFPYLPCCFEKDQINNPKSKFSEYYLGMGKQSAKISKSGGQVTTMKFVNLNKTGKLPAIVNDVLLRSPVSKENSEYIRYGTLQSPNSILHSIIQAIGMQDGKNATYREYAPLRLNRSVDEKTPYLEKLRQFIFENTEHGLMKQELYDWTDADIVEATRNADRFLDPALFYRALEETFQINIWVFTQNIGEDAKLELPRHRQFHTRRYRPERPSIIIFKNVGAESDSDKYPQCELIVDSGKNKNIENINVKGKFIFGAEMTNYLFSLFEQSHTQLMYFKGNNSIKGLLNLYNSLDWDFGIVAHQYIDDYGKMRGIRFTPGSGRKEAVNIFLPPSQPLNEIAYMTDQITQFPNCGLSQTLSLFGNDFSSITYNEDRSKVTGVWYPLFGLENMIYVPIAELSVKNQVVKNNIQGKPEGPANPLYSEKTSFAIRYKNLQKKVTIFLQTVIWVYQLFAAKNGYISDDLSVKREGVEEFAKRFMIVGNSNTNAPQSFRDTENIYNFDKVPEDWWPEVSNPKIAIKRLLSADTGMIIDDRIYCYNKWFANKILYNLERFLKGKVADLPLTSIVNVLNGQHDFSKGVDELIIVGRENFKTWMEYKKQQLGQNYIIREKLDVKEIYDNLNPIFFFNKKTQKRYIIQKVKYQNLESAISTVREWEEAQVNDPTIKTIAEEVDLAEIPHIVYGISGSDGQLYIEENNSGGQTNYAEVIEYAREESSEGIRGLYAAMLPLP